MLTTNGKLVKELENKLKKKFGIKYLLITCNGTVSLEIALKTLNIKKGVLTSPFSYVSTPNACNWLNIKVFFSDIETEKYTIDLNKIDKKILDKIDCILPTHVFGIEANIEKLNNLAKKYKKKLIFDAAHCFGIKFKGKSILSYGDVSIVSFQATKIFNTCEGGAVIFKKKQDYDKARKLINIGYDYELNDPIPAKGINAKMSELNAAWGLSLLENIQKIIKQKKNIYNIYLKNLDNEKVNLITKNFRTNYNYVPILFSSKSKRDLIIKKLRKKNIFPRKYFFPSLNTLKHLRAAPMPVSESVCSRIVCLPIYEDIRRDAVMKIIKIVNHYA